MDIKNLDAVSYANMSAEITSKAWIPTWAHNSRMNCSFINEQYLVRDINASAAIDRLKGKRDISQFLITGAGPSLETLDISSLKKFDGVVIAGNSTASYLSMVGRPADIIIICDAGPDTFEKHLSMFPVKEDGSLLVCANQVDPRITSLFHKEDVYFFKSVPFNRKGNNNEAVEFYSNFVNLLFGDAVREFQIMGGCVLFQELLYPHHLVNSKKIETFKVFAAGAELSYPNGIKAPHRVNQYFFNEEEKTWHSFSQSDLCEKLTRYLFKIKHNRKTYHVTNQMLRYKDSLMALWITKQIPVWRLTTDGIINEWPKADLKTLVTKGPKQYDNMSLQLRKKKFTEWRKNYSKWIKIGIEIEKDYVQKEIKRRKEEVKTLQK